MLSPAPNAPVKGHHFSPMAPGKTPPNGVNYGCSVCGIEVLVPAHFLTADNLKRGVDLHLDALTKKACTSP